MKVHFTLEEMKNIIEKNRADERERCIDEVLVAIDIWAGEIQLNPELVAVIEAIKAE